jgi:hypothetical protein
MYRLYLDESGTHVGSNAFVLAGLAVHEQDAWHFQQKLNESSRGACRKGQMRPTSSCMRPRSKNPVKTVRGKKVKSIWARIPVDERFRVISSTFRAIGNYDCRDSSRQCASLVP